MRNEDVVKTKVTVFSHRIPIEDFAPGDMLDGDLSPIGSPDPSVHRSKPTSAKHTAHSVVLLKA